MTGVQTCALPISKAEEGELTNLPKGETSEVIRQRVIKARNIQIDRFKEARVHCNARMLPKHVREFCKLDTEAENLLKSAVLHLKMSGRCYDRILKVSRTIADLEGSADIRSAHIAEAIQYRAMDRN